MPTKFGAWPSALLNKRVFGYLSWRFRRARIHRMEVLDALRRDLIEAAPDHVAVTGDIVNISLPSELHETASGCGASDHHRMSPSCGESRRLRRGELGAIVGRLARLMTSDQAEHAAPPIAGSPLVSVCP